jgi:hypothetical protein
MADNVRSTTVPSVKQAALDLTCAILSTGAYTNGHKEHDAQVAIELLNHLEARMGVAKTRGAG